MTRKPHTRGKRGGRSTRELRDIHSKVRGVFRAQASSAAPTCAIMDRSKYFSVAGIDETPEDHIIPRRSVTVDQILAVRKVQRETVTLHAKQLDHATDQVFTSVQDALERGRMIKTTDQREVWRSDNSLLIKGTPGSKIGTFKRDGSIQRGLNRQRTRTTEPETPATDTIIGPAIDVTNADGDQ